jgi:RimJ/RimL family protein N-acetyltransferase
MAAFTAQTKDVFLAYWAEIRADRAVLAQTITVNGEVAGNIMCWEKWDQRQVGYWIGRRYWGRGVATSALALLICRVPIRPLYAYVAVHNQASMRVLEKGGFQRIGDDTARSALVEYALEI